MTFKHTACQNRSRVFVSLFQQVLSHLKEVREDFGSNEPLHADKVPFIIVAAKSFERANDLW